MNKITFSLKRGMQGAADRFCLPACKAPLMPGGAVLSVNRINDVRVDLQAIVDVITRQRVSLHAEVTE